jgi:hypothetical protein
MHSSFVAFTLLSLAIAANNVLAAPTNYNNKGTFSGSGGKSDGGSVNAVHGTDIMSGLTCFGQTNILASRFFIVLFDLASSLPHFLDNAAPGGVTDSGNAHGSGGPAYSGVGGSAQGGSVNGQPCGILNIASSTCLFHLAQSKS